MTTLLEDFIKLHPIITSFKTTIEKTCLSRKFEPRVPSEDYIFGQKSDFEATLSRNLGNMYFRSGQFEEALKYYTKSVSTAPINGGELGFAYGNRSAVLLHLKEYEYCLLDVNRALNLENVSKALRQKLTERKIKCWELLQQVNTIKSSFKLMFGAVVPFSPYLRKLNHSNDISVDQTDLIIDYSSLDDPVWNIKLDNELLPDASRKVKIDYNSKWGRHWVATEDIDPGNVLLVQEYFASNLLENSIYKCCAHCSMLCLALIPCFTCSWEMYCSESCREKAYNLYHRTECKIQQLLILNKDHRLKLLLSVRMFLIGTSQGCELTKLMNDPEVYSILGGNGNCVGVKYTANDYFSILNLCWKIDESLLDVTNLNCVTTILQTLQYVQFFENLENGCQSSNYLSDTELFTAILLMQHMSLPSYYCALHVSYPTASHNSGLQHDDVSYALGTLQSLMNHSCYPNTSVISNRKKILVYSMRPIKVGEQLFTSYGLNYYVASLESRQKYFKNHYDMVCSCTACVENWPVPTPGIENKYLTSEKDIIEKIEDMQCWLQNKISSSMPHAITEYDFQNAFKFIKNFYKFLQPPSRAIILCDFFVLAYIPLKGPLYVLESMSTVTNPFSDSL